MMRASEQSPRMFENDFLDFFSRTHWLVVPAFWLPIAAGFVGYALWQGEAPWLVAGSVVLGLGLWSISEYWLHRTLFHWEPKTSWGPALHFLLHGVHHKWHQDPYRLVMPPAVSLVLAVGLYAMLRGVVELLALGGVPIGWHYGAWAGFTVGYVVYDCTHYFLHHFRPKSARMKRLRAHHMNHHHNDPDKRFGVSSTFWDRVFGTS